MLTDYVQKNEEKEKKEEDLTELRIAWMQLNIRVKDSKNIFLKMCKGEITAASNSNINNFRIKI